MQLVANQPAAVTRKALRKLTIEQLTSLAYGETAPVPLMADIPAWVAELAYNELDRRMFG